MWIATYHLCEGFPAGLHLKNYRELNVKCSILIIILSIVPLHALYINFVPVLQLCPIGQYIHVAIYFDCGKSHLVF